MNNVLQLVWKKAEIRQTKPEKLKKGLKFYIGQLFSEPFNLYAD